MSDSASPAAVKPARGFRGQIIDCDVHHIWRTPAELARYLPAATRDRLRIPGRPDAFIPLRPPSTTQPHLRTGFKRPDAAAPDGSQPGSDYETLRAQLLDGVGVQFAVLSFDVGYDVGYFNPYLGVEIGRAANDWSIAEWLARDERLGTGLQVSTQMPDEGAAEVRRAGQHPRAMQVVMAYNAIGTLSFGHPIFHPIYEAAAELDLPISIHLAWIGHGVTYPAGLGTRFENYTLLPVGVQHHLASFISHGVFERFPNLKLMVVESGVAWLPWMMHSLDAHYRLLREESRWVKRWPSEYIHDHVFVTTQPFEIGDDAERIVDMLRTLDGIEDNLCFSTDYPHWDGDDPTYVARLLPDAWLPKLFHDNAVRLFGSRGAALGLRPLAAT